MPHQVARTRRLYNPAYATSGAASDADVTDWVSRVQGQGSNVSQSTTDAVTTFATAIKATSGLWSKLKRVNLYAGNDLNSVKVPLINVWGNATDTLANFVGGDYNETGGSGGLTGDGSTKYIDTGIIPGDVTTAAGNLQSWHMAVYNRTSSNQAAQAMGCQNAGFVNDTAILVSYSGTSYWDCWGFTDGRISVGDSGGTGLYVGSRTDATHTNLYKNGTSIISGTVDDSAYGGPGTISGHTAYVAVHAFHSGVGGYSGFNTRTFSFYSVGTGLSSSDVTALTSAVQTFQTSLARQV